MTVRTPKSSTRHRWVIAAATAGVAVGLAFFSPTFAGQPAPKVPTVPGTEVEPSGPARPAEEPPVDQAEQGSQTPISPPADQREVVDVPAPVEPPADNPPTESAPAVAPPVDEAPGGAVPPAVDSSEDAPKPD